MDMQCFTDILRKHITPEQITAIRQEVTDADDGGHCPICFAEDVPVDESGNEIYGDDMSQVDEWRERHEENCPISLLA